MEVEEIRAKMDITKRILLGVYNHGEMVLMNQ